MPVACLSRAVRCIGPEQTGPVTWNVTGRPLFDGYWVTNAMCEELLDCFQAAIALLFLIIVPQLLIIILWFYLPG
jgi:hypothetical protein